MKTRVLLMCVAAAAVLTGCDWVKARLGLATSGEIDRLKQELLEKERKERHLQDSLARLRADSLQKAEALRAEAEKTPELRFHVIVGSYVEKINADNREMQMREWNIPAYRIASGNGYDMVAVGEGFRTLEEACRMLNKMYRDERFLPDLWIYDAQAK